jgi:hypothetical protein
MSAPSLPCFGRRDCDICGRALTVHEEALGSICDSPGCRGRALAERLKTEAKARRRIRRRVEWERMRILAGFGVPDPARVLPIAVPSNDHPLANLPEERREEFEAHLRETAEAAGEGRFTLPDDPWVEREQTEDDVRVVAAACALCRGKCCQTGHGRKAYVDAALRAFIASLVDDRVDRHSIVDRETETA